MPPMVSPRLREDMRQSFAWLRTASVSMLRPWNEFFTGFRVPESGWAEAEKRAGVNAAYFAANYFAVIVACQIFTAVTSPLLIVVLVMCALGTAVLFRPFKEIREPVRALLPAEWHRAVAAAVMTACFLLGTGYLWSVLLNALIGAGLVAVHMLVKTVTTRSRAAKLWFSARVFADRVADDLPDDSRSASLAQPAGTSAEPWHKASPSDDGFGLRSGAADMDLGAEAGAVDVDLGTSPTPGASTHFARQGAAVKRD
ncbi:hypothetical protein FNF27_02555 [Cafeteria roenbergensis]|uniref:PRA1 family protein n=1 Tax=Cafeteria roenbergensis TaxID=33653 RepID=A0A5A8EF16_CAFRO|nr:hypothetical protein FNF27_02555 [Cafeteria roenbergensis]